MGVQFDRILDGFDGPFTKINGLLPPPAGIGHRTGNPAGYLISHRINNSFVLINRLLKANADVYWLKKDGHADGQDLGTGTIWVPASARARSVLEQGAKELGVPAHAVAKAPVGRGDEAEADPHRPLRSLRRQHAFGLDAVAVRAVRISVHVVYPQTLDAGDLKSKFDVIVFTDGALSAPRRGRTRRRGGGFGGRSRSGKHSGGVSRPDWAASREDKTMPQLKKFVESGGSIVTIGSSTSMAELFGLPVKNYLTEKGPDGQRARAAAGEILHSRVAAEDEYR